MGPGVTDSVVVDRSVGVVPAAAAGDAPGAGYEFGPALGPDAPVGLVGGGPFEWAPGEWTDDTRMSICVLSVLAAGRHDVTEIETAFRAWFSSGPTDAGVQTAAVLSAAVPLAEAAADDFAEHPDRSAGNGSLMRTAPVALAHPGTPGAIAALAGEVSALTHADPDCVDACVLWSVAIDHTIRQAPQPAEPWDWTEALHTAVDQLHPTRRDRWVKRIAAARPAPRGSRAMAGWCTPSRPRSPRSAPHPSRTVRRRSATSSTPCEPRSAPAATPTPWPPSPGRCSVPAGERPRCRPTGATCCTVRRCTGASACTRTTSNGSPGRPPGQPGRTPPTDSPAQPSPLRRFGGPIGAACDDWPSAGWATVEPCAGIETVHVG